MELVQTWQGPVGTLVSDATWLLQLLQRAWVELVETLANAVTCLRHQPALKESCVETVANAVTSKSPCFLRASTFFF